MLDIVSGNLNIVAQNITVPARVELFLFANHKGNAATIFRLFSLENNWGNKKEANNRESSRRDTLSGLINWFLSFIFELKE